MLVGALTDLHKYFFDIGGIECRCFHEDGVHFLGIVRPSLPTDL